MKNWLILAAGTIVFVIAQGFYITPQLLGSQTDPTVASQIADQVYNQGDVAGASAASVMLLTIAVATIALATAAIGTERLRRAIA